MSKWDKLKKTLDVGQKVNNAKNTAQQVKDDGIGNTIKSKVKGFSVRKMGKSAKVAMKSFIKFLMTPPWGWITAGILLVVLWGLFTVPSSNISDGGVGDVEYSEGGVNGTKGDNLVTKEDYAAMAVGCPTPTTGGVSGSVDIKPGSKEYTLDEVTKFATSSLKSTWNISDDTAASYFLSHNAGVATKYGLSTGNIGEVTKAVKDAGVSPAFFYLYAVTEGGGAGGFINHYGSDSGAGARADAVRDAEYLVQWANSVGGSPATETWSLGNMPTDKPQKILDKMPKGSIGRVYIQATAAVTMELNELSGVTWDRNPSFSFGRPITHMMNMITSVGGDVNSGDQIAIDAGGTGDSAKCNPLGGGDSDLKSGGMNIADARKFMLDKYQNASVTMADIAGAAPGTPDIRDNCVAFSAFFVHKYTSLNFGAGNGMDVAANMVKANPKLKLEHTPSVYSIFSIAPFGGPNMAGDVGHTGVVMGIDKEKGVAIVGQASYGMPFTTIDSWSSGVNAMEIELSKMTEANGWSFVNVKDYVKGLK